MLMTLLVSCLTASMSSPAVELRPGRPLTDECSGWLDLMLWIHEEHYINTGELFGGKVVAIEEDTITIQKLRRVARTFPVAPPLTSRRIPLEWSLGTGHRLLDVRVGDKVTMDLARGRDGPVCIRLGIYRRPGGTIPPAEDAHLPERSRLHIRCNIAQFLEETLTPKWVPWMSVHFR